jgi:phosphoribosylformylglycinamidine cyclo-ligase
MHARIDINSWQQGPIFDWLADRGGIATDEMRRTFNCGVGMALVVAHTDAADAVKFLEASGETAWQLGEIVNGAGEVQYR